MPALPSLFIELRADIRQFSSQFGVAEKQIDRITRQGGGSLDRLSTVGRAAFLGLGAAAVGFGVAGVKLASDLAEAKNKTEVTFGGAANQVKAFADEMASKFGVVRSTTLDAVSGFGLVTRAAGLTQQASATLGVELARAADDATSLYNVPLPDALRDIRSGLVGEAEPMRKYGVLLSEAAVKQEAYRRGLAAAGSELTEQQKVQARAALILQGLSVATGDHERTQGSMANRLREVQGRAANLAGTYGELLIPATLKALDGGLKFGEFLGENKVLAVGLAVAIGGPLVVSMGAYVTQLVRTNVQHGILVAAKIPQFFLAVGAAVQGTTAATVALNSSLAGVLATTALGAISIAAPLGAMLLLWQRNEQAADRFAARVVAAAGPGTQAQLDALKAKLAEVQRELQGAGSVNVGFGRFFFSDTDKKLANQADALKSKIKDLEAQLEGEGSGARSAAAGTTEFGDATSDAKQKAEQFSQTVRAMRSDLFGVLSAQRSVRDAQDGIRDATSNVNDAHKRLQELLRRSPVDLQAVAAAQKDVMRTSKDLATAQDDLAAAQANLNTVRQGTPARDLREAELDVAAAKRDQEKASVDLAKAQDDLNRTVTVGIVGAGQQAGTWMDVADAQLGVADAKERVERTDIAAQKAQERLTQLQQAGKDGSKELKDAMDLLAQKTDAVAQAQDRVREADEKLQTVQQPDKQLTEDITGARDALAKAEENLAKQKDGLRDSELQLWEATQKTNDAMKETPAAVDAVRASIEAFKRQFPDAKSLGNAALALLPPPTPAGQPLPGSEPTSPGNLRLAENAAAAGRGVLVTGDVVVKIGDTQFARITQDQLAASARRNGLS